MLYDNDFCELFFSSRELVIKNYNLTYEEIEALKILDLETIQSFKRVPDNRISPALAVWYSEGLFIK